jgi:hypothetical protein
MSIAAIVCLVLAFVVLLWFVTECMPSYGRAGGIDNPLPLLWIALALFAAGSGLGLWGALA